VIYKLKTNEAIRIRHTLAEIAALRSTCVATPALQTARRRETRPWRRRRKTPALSA
jgi:hypothetical protein